MINNGVSTSELLTALGSAAFPAGASVTPRTGFNLTRPVRINNINTDIWGASITKLEQELNQQVYALYALTPEEIQIIEEAVV